MGRLLEPDWSPHLGRVVGDLGFTDRGPIDALEVGVSLDLLDVAEADPLRGVLGQELLDQVLRLLVDVGPGEGNLLALLDIVVRLEIRSTLEGRRPTEELVEDDPEGPIITGVAQVSVAEGLGRQVLLSADERVHALVG